MDKSNLPVDVRTPIVHDREIVSGLTGIPANKIGKRGYKLPDDEEVALLEEVQFGYVKVLEGHALNNITTGPTPAEVWISARKGKLANALRKANAKGNGYDKLLIPATNKDQSAIWKIALMLMREPAKYGINDVPALMADVEFEYTGKDGIQLQAKD